MTLPSLHDFRPSATAPNRCAYCSFGRLSHSPDMIACGGCGGSGVGRYSKVAGDRCTRCMGEGVMPAWPYWRAGPWSVNAHERGPEYSAVEWALRDVGITGSKEGHSTSVMAEVVIGALRKWEGLNADDVGQR